MLDKDGDDAAFGWLTTSHHLQLTYEHGSQRVEILIMTRHNVIIVEERRWGGIYESFVSHVSRFKH